MEETLQKTRLQITEYWKELDRKKKLNLILIIGFAIIIVTGIVYSLTYTKYEVLYSNLSLKDISQMSAKLDEMGTPWEIGNDQRSIMVPAKNKDKIKVELASYGYPKQGYTFTDAFNDSSWTMTDYDKKQRYKLALESELAAKISEIEGIYSANIFIYEKESNNFMLNDDTEKTTASVFIVKDGKKSISNDKVNAIRHLVAGPVSNLDPDDVSVIDDEGRLLGDLNDDDIFGVEQFAIKQNLETRVNDSIKRFLENIVGYGNVDVRSSVKINMDIENTRIIEFSPPIEGNEEGLIRSLEEAEEHMVGGVDGGNVGVDPNIPGENNMFEDGSSKYDRVSRIINNELNEINKEIRKAPGQVESITVAVLINKDALIDGEMTPEREKELTELIYAATGLDTKDVQIRSERFTKEVIDYGITPGKTNLLLYIGLIVLLLAIIIIARIIQQSAKSRKTDEEDLERLFEEKSSINLEVADLDFEAEESKIKAQIDNFIEKKPESVAQLLRNWLNE